MSRKRKNKKSQNITQEKAVANVESKTEAINSKQETTKFVTGCLVVVLCLAIITGCFFLDKNAFSFAHREPDKNPDSYSHESQVVDEWTEGNLNNENCVYALSFNEGSDELLDLPGIDYCKEATVIYGDEDTKVEVKLGYENVTYTETNNEDENPEYVEPTGIEYNENVIQTDEVHAAIKSIKVNDVEIPVKFFADDYEWLDRIEYMIPIVSRYDNILVYKIEPRYQLGGFDGVITDVEGNYVKEFLYEQDLTYEDNKLTIYSLTNGERVCDDVCTSLGNNSCNIGPDDSYMSKITIDTLVGVVLEPEIATYREMCANLGE